MSEDMHFHACLIGNVEIGAQCSLSHKSEDVTAYDNLFEYRRLSLNSGAICKTSLSLRVQLSALRVNEWLLFHAKSAIFLLYHGEKKLIFNEMMMRSGLFYPYTLFWFGADQSLLFLLHAACLAEKQQANFIVFGLTRPGLEPTIYRTRGDPANHYRCRIPKTSAEYRRLLRSTTLCFWTWETAE